LLAGILVDLDCFLEQKLLVWVHELVIFCMIVLMAIVWVIPQPCPEVGCFKAFIGWRGSLGEATKPLNLSCLLTSACPFFFEK
jgi:hypothetical protein